MSDTEATRSMLEEQPLDTHLGFVLLLAHQALTAADLDESVVPLLEGVLDQTAARGVLYLERVEGSLVPRAALDESPEGDGWKGILRGGVSEEGFLVRTVEKAESPVFFDEAAGRPESPVDPSDGTSAEDHAVAVGPILDGDETVLGALVGYGSPNHEWTEWEEGVFNAVAAVLSSLSARLRAESDARTARESALRALGQAIEYRDYETKGHTDRVTALAAQVGGHLGLDPSRLQELRWGAYLHDIGKLAVPDRILLKPGKLDEDEWEAMKSHVEAGESFARELGFLPDGTLELIRHHHERWDGGGYPDGLREEEIPLLARIFCACDALDAMTSQRPYNEPKTVEEALAEIAAEAGTQFDPEVAAVFARIDLHDRL